MSTRRWLAPLLLALLPTAVTQVASAQAKPAAKPGAPAPAPVAPPPPRASGLVQLAGELARTLGEVPAGAIVVASAMTSDVPAPKGDELSVRAASLVSAQLNAAHPHPQPASLPVARALSGRAASLVYLQLEIAKGTLRVTADLYPVVSNGWERLRNPAPGPRAHAFASSALDAEIRAFLQPIVLEQAQLHKAKLDEPDVLAIGCGDVDADGGLELVLASRARVVVGKLKGQKLEVVRGATWNQLAARVPVPLREPVASVIVSPPARRGEILVGTTDRGAVAIDGSLVTRGALTGLPVPGSDGEACAQANPEVGLFDGPAVTCAAPAKGEPTAVLPLPVARYDAFAAFDLVDRAGTTARVVAAREPRGVLKVRRTDASGKSVDTQIDGVGAQVALGDLDLDGTVEIAFSGDSPDGGDALAVWSWNGAKLQQRLRYQTKEAVRAIGTCPAEERGVPALVAVVGSEVWLVR